MTGRDAHELMDAAAGGDRRSVARLLSMVERGGDDARAAGALAHARSGGAYTVGITGAPGAGKSTLTSAVVGELRQRGERVSVLAIDPSSPFTGGAILGDRIRMQDHALDEGVPGPAVRATGLAGRYRSVGHQHRTGWRRSAAWT